MIKCFTRLSFLTLGLLAFVMSAEAEDLNKTLAFPSAEGFGAYASGGRGGKVVEVTNIEDDGTNPPEGSFRWALNQYKNEPITVVFRVSGCINLKAELRCKRDNYTIAGQTAPGDGICIRGNKVNFGGSNNLILRHLRFRVGIVVNADGTTATSGKGSIGIENASNFIIDHCTFGWSGEENMTIYDNKNTTIQWCIVHEGLYQAGHDKGNRGYGTQWGGSSATFHHNLLAHNYNRSPRFNGARSNDLEVLIDYVNNVNYNWGKENSCYGGDIEKESHRANMVNNYYKPGPARPSSSRSYFVQSSYGNIAGKTAVWWMSGNVMEGNSSYTSNNYLGLDKSKYPAEYQGEMEASAPFEVPYPVKTETAQEAYLSVLEKAGAFPRDVVDLRIIEEVQTGKASGSGVYGTNKGIIDNPDAVGGYPDYNSDEAPVDSDHDGMPDWWENENGLNPNDPEDGNKLTVDGYTALEVYLNSLVNETIELDFNTSIINESLNNKPNVSLDNNILSIYSAKPVSMVKIYDSLGRLRAVEKVNTDKINVSKLLSGVYILEVVSDEGEKYVTKINK